MTRYLIQHDTIDDVIDALKKRKSLTGDLKISDAIAEIKLLNRDKCMDLFNKTIVNYSNSNIDKVKAYAFNGCQSLKEINLPMCSYIGECAFSRCRLLINASFPMCAHVGNNAFYANFSLSAIDFPVCTNIEHRAFANCSSILEAKFPMCENIGYSAFVLCSSLAFASFPVCKNIGSNAFYSCKNLSEIHAPMSEDVGSNAFYLCDNLESINFPACTVIGDSAFYWCNKLSLFESPICTVIGMSAFYNCTSLSSANFPECSNVKYGAFSNCKNLASVNLSKCESISGYAFANCEKLTSMDLPVCANIAGSYTFSGCAKLSEITLGASSVCALGYSNTFMSTPIASGSGRIYVPTNLVESYKTATNWALYSNAITPLDGVVVSSMDDSILVFGENRQISLDVMRGGSCAEIDVTATVTSSDESIITVSDVVISNEMISFTLNTQQTEGTATIHINASCGDYSYSSSGNVDVYETIPEATWSVQSVSGASYDFELNDNGYYESKNKGVNNSAAVCKLTFDTKGFYSLYLDCINYAEPNFDYGLISNLDTELSTSYSADSSSKLSKSFKGLSNASVQTVELGAVPAGDHFVYIKFIKDSSAANNNDSLQFKVRMEML